MTLDIIIPQEMKGHKYQQIVYQSTQRFVLSEAGRRGGKTRANGVTAPKRIYQDFFAGKGEPSPSIKRNMPRLQYWCVAPDYALCQIQKREFYRIFGNSIQKDDISKNRIWLYPEILVEFKSGENPNKLVAVGLNGLWITETARLKKNVWNDNLRPCLSDKMGWLLSDTTPLGNNWYVTELADLADPTKPNYDPDYLIVKWKTTDNTCIPGLADEVEKARKTMPKKYFLRNYEACRDAFFGQIYDEFDFNVHVKTWDINKDQYKVILAGQDWGYTHCGVLMIIGITNDDDVHVLKEISRDKTPVVSQSEDQISWVKIARKESEEWPLEIVYAGPDQPEHIDEYKKGDILCVPADNAVSPRIQMINTLMHIDDQGRSKLVIHSSCKKLIENLPKYVWKGDRDENESEQPLKENDDEIDALGYAIYSARHWLKIGYIDADANSTEK